MPLKSQLHEDKLLGNISVKYRNEEYIADKVFPILPVKKETDKYRIYDRNFRLPETIRSAKGEAREHLFDVSSASYRLEQHSLKDHVSDRDAENYDIFDLRRDTVEELTDVIARRMEKSVADLFTTTGWSLNVSLAAANAFNANTTVSNPIPIFDTAATTIVNNSGNKPNYGILPREAYIACKNHTSVLDRVKYTSAEMGPAKLAGLFDLEELLIPHSVIDTAAKGQASSISAIFGDIAFVGYKPQRPGPMKPSAGYIFRNAIPSVKRWREEKRQSEAIEVNLYFDPKIVSSLSGYLIKDVI